MPVNSTKEQRISQEKAKDIQSMLMFMPEQDMNRTGRIWKQPVKKDNITATAASIATRKTKSQKEVSEPKSTVPKEAACHQEESDVGSSSGKPVSENRKNWKELTMPVNSTNQQRISNEKVKDRVPTIFWY